jgi:hypothetical protein
MSGFYPILSQLFGHCYQHNDTYNQEGEGIMRYVGGATCMFD